MWNRTTISQKRILPLDHKDILNCSNIVKKRFIIKNCEVFKHNLKNALNQNYKPRDDDARYVLHAHLLHSADGR